MPEPPREFRLMAFCANRHRTSLRTYEEGRAALAGADPGLLLNNVLCDKPGCGLPIVISALAYQQAEPVGVGKRSGGT